MILAGHYRETLLKHYCVLGDFKSAASYMFEIVGKRGENLTTEEVMERAAEKYSAQFLFDLEQFYQYGLNKSLVIEQRGYDPEDNIWSGSCKSKDKDKDKEYFKKCYWDRDERALVELVFSFREGYDEDNTPTFDKVDVTVNNYDWVWEMTDAEITEYASHSTVRQEK